MQQTEALIRSIKMDDAIVGMRNDGIVHVYFRPCTVIDVPLQLKLLDAYHEITGGKKTPFIFEAGEYISVTREAKENAIVIEEITPTLASAVLINNFAQKLIAVFYYKIKPPKQPYKVVWKFEKGVEWLQQVSATLQPVENKDEEGGQ
jgi:hypothetical protein